MLGRIYVGDYLELVKAVLTDLIYKLWVSWLQSIRFLEFFPIIRLWKLLIPAGASIDPRGLIGRIYVADH